MNFFNLKNKPDPWDFQEKAIACIVSDFKKNMAGRFLLVLPTGGGKTLTAIRAISEMIRQGQISKQDKVLWVVHTLSLHSHAKKNLDKKENYSKFGLHPKLASIINVRMKSDAVKELESGYKYKLIIIDEAHHAAAEKEDTATLLLESAFPAEYYNDFVPGWNKMLEKIKELAEK